MINQWLGPEKKRSDDKIFLRRSERKPSLGRGDGKRIQVPQKEKSGKPPRRQHTSRWKRSSQRAKQGGRKQGGKQRRASKLSSFSIPCLTSHCQTASNSQPISVSSTINEPKERRYFLPLLGSSESKNADSSGKRKRPLGKRARKKKPPADLKQLVCLFIFFLSSCCRFFIRPI